MTNERPVVTLTLRRTGGTSMMLLLQSCSPFPRLQHEPLNADRVLGNITKQFLADADQANLRKGLKVALSARPNIKHCVETVPLPVTEALIHVCKDLDYQFLLWRRDNLEDRVISLFLAQQTSLWGSNGRGKLAESVKNGSRKLASFDLKALEHQVNHDRFVWNSTRLILKELSVDAVVSSYEYLYDPPEQQGNRAKNLLHELGFDVAADAQEIRTFVAAKPERPTSLTEAVPNIHEARRLLQSMEKEH